MLRVGAYEGDELVGWSFGWLERGNVFYMACSGVRASHRRRGIYTSLLNAIRVLALAEGAREIHSKHSVLNNPIVIAKLRAGFNVSGLLQSAKLGTLVELTLHLSEKRKNMFRHRVLPYVGRDAGPRLRAAAGHRRRAGVLNALGRLALHNAARAECGSPATPAQG